MEQGITKGNIEEVLKHNGIKGFNVLSRHVSLRHGNTEMMTRIPFSHPNWMQMIETWLGRPLAPLPAPVFDFGKYLCKHGFTPDEGFKHIIENDKIWIGVYKEHFNIHCEAMRSINNKNNADKILQIVKLLGELE
jgi:hypothetical protein